MAASGRRRGPAPIASFDHDVSDESSPETKQSFRLPEIREDPACSTTNVATTSADSAKDADGLAPPEQRARSHSSPAVHAHTSTSAASAPTGGLQTPAAPRIDISRASSSSHQDSRDSSPELALFAGGGDDSRNRLELGFREDGALDLRSSTEELAFLEGAPGAPSTSGEARSAPPAAPLSRRHSRKDSQGSEAALLGVSGRTSRLSSVGSQCSAHSALSGFSHTSRVSRLSVVSGTSRSPSPHKMLLETSFCGPKPIETDPEICAAAVEERLLEIAKMSNTDTPQQPATTTPTSAPPPTPIPVDARDRREVRTEATVESARSRSASVNRVEPVVPPPCAPIIPPAQITITQDEDKLQKETANRARAEERRARSRERREPSQPEVYKSRNRSKDIIRIRLKPDSEYEDDDDESDHTVIGGEPARKPASLELTETCIKPARLIEPAPVSPLSTNRRQRDSRTPSPAGVPVSRKSSFCSLFKSRETIASPDSPSDALRRKKSLNEGRSRSKSRDRSATPSSAGKIKGSVLSLFKTPRKSATSPSPSSRDGSPGVQPQRQFAQPTIPPPPRGEKLKYYEDTKDGIIHIPLKTPPEEIGKKPEVEERIPTRDIVRPASAPQPRSLPERPSSVTPSLPSKPTQRTVLPDGSIIIPLHSPTEKSAECASMSSAEPTSEPGPSISLGEREEQATLDKSVDDRSETSSVDPRQSKMALNDIAPSTTKVEAGDSSRPRKKERIIFTTHVGSREQVFSTQFSITKTPSVTSEISESIPSFYENDDGRTTAPVLRDTHITSAESRGEVAGLPAEDSVEGIASAAGTPGDAPGEGPRDSSESEPSSEAAPARTGNEVERRGLVVQESFEEELPYVPTTLPQERSVALPMVPVRERGGVRVAGVQRPRARAPAALPAPRAPLTPPAAPPAPAAPARSPAAPAPPERIRIQLPRRARAASASGPSRRDRPRTRSGGDLGGEARSKPEWIDFEEVPERRKQPKRIQTLPAAGGAGGLGGAAGGAGEGVVFSYVEPEECRCECHARQDDELPLLNDDSQNLRNSASSPECAAPPFTADLPLRPPATPDSTRPQ